MKSKPIVIDMPTNPTKMVVTDGFHITQPIELVYTKKAVRYFKIVCAIEDAQLLFGLLFTIILYAMGYTSGFLLLQLISMAPVFYFLFIYYINRKEFIRILPV
jgi:hypothetical protein